VAAVAGDDPLGFVDQVVGVHHHRDPAGRCPRRHEDLVEPVEADLVAAQRRVEPVV
jgi:hypothetical protein